MLQEEVNRYVKKGFRVVSQTAQTAQLVKSKKFSLLFAFLWFLLAGVGIIVDTLNIHTNVLRDVSLDHDVGDFFLFAFLWFLLASVGIIVYFAWYVAKRDKQVYLTVDETGRISRNSRISKRTLAIVGGTIVGGLILLGLIRGLSETLKPDCTVGYSNSNLNIEVSGQGADAACRQFIPAGPGANTDGFPYAGLDPATGQPYGTGRVGQPSGDVICRVTLGTLIYTVRDSGLVKLYGSVACENLRADQSAIHVAFPRVAFVMTGECPIGQPYCASGWDKLSPPFTSAVEALGRTANGDWDMFWSYNCTGSHHYFYTSVRDGDGKTQATGDFTQPNDSDPHGSGVMHAHDNPDAGLRTVDAGASAGCAWTVMVIILGPPS